MTLIRDLATDAAKQALRIAIDKLANALLHGRSCILQVNNMTGGTLTRMYDDHTSGGFASGDATAPGTPDRSIPANAASVFGSESGGVAVGAIGLVRYAGDGVELTAQWSNPFFGDNTAMAYATGQRAGLFWTTSIAGNGDEKAHFAYDFIWAAQDKWHWCKNCEGLFFAGNPTRGACPGAGGSAHDPTGSGNYGVVMNQPTSVALQDKWRWCRKCEGLFYGGSPANAGVCPAGGAHDAAQSGNYALNQGFPFPGAQPGWRWCHKCQGLHFVGSRFGPCPAGGNHEVTSSGNYSVTTA